MTCVSYIGEHFRIICTHMWTTDQDVGKQRGVGTEANNKTITWSGPEIKCILRSTEYYIKQHPFPSLR